MSLEGVNRSGLVFGKLGEEAGGSLLKTGVVGYSGSFKNLEFAEDSISSAN
ncbi:hypothetical protein [Alkalibacterium psychrotolerans]